MRYLVAVTVALLIVCMVIPASGASSETDWRVSFISDDGFGAGSFVGAQAGVGSNFVDGAEFFDTYLDYFVDLPGTTRIVAAVIPGDTTNTHLRDIRSPAAPASYPQGEKVWDLRVAASPNANSMPIRLRMRSTAVNPAETAGGLPFTFELVMTDNKGVSGAPANGTKWSVPIPTGGNNEFFWSMDTDADQNGIVWGSLPLIKLSQGNSAAMLSEGYNLQFVQRPGPQLMDDFVPEPSSLLALSAGIGLLGFARRRRR